MRRLRRTQKDKNSIQINRLMKEITRKLEKVGETNLEELIKYCIDNAKLIK